MNKVLEFIKKIWHDSVWSKVIAAVIVASASYASGLIPWIWRTLLSLIESDPYKITTWVLGLLLSIVSILFWQRRPKKDVRLVGIKWIRQLTITQLSKYGFLFWFPLNRRLKTHTYDQSRSFISGRISFDHIPEIRELIDRRVLRYTFEGLGQYSVEIDQEVYNYLEHVYEQERALIDEETRLVFDAYNTVPFDSLFPDVRQY